MTSLLHEILEGEPLTERETEILEGVAEGETAVQTGKRLYLSSETVKGYRKRVIAKLGARNAPHAVAVAIRRGLLPATQKSPIGAPIPVALRARSPRSAR
jgi:DNA-binding CsgD family transcriptional regulator